MGTAVALHPSTAVVPHAPSALSRVGMKSVSKGIPHGVVGAAIGAGIGIGAGLHHRRSTHSGIDQK